MASPNNFIQLTSTLPAIHGQLARANAMASETDGDDGEGYGVLVISDALGEAEVVALEKVRSQNCLITLPGFASIRSVFFVGKTH